MSDDETKREDDVLRQMLATKPTPHKKPSPTTPKRRRGGLGEQEAKQG